MFSFDFTTYIFVTASFLPSIECTYSHFNNSSTCPVCQRTLGANDFMELVVADPSSATEETLKNTFQTMFTKYSSASNIIGHHELCSRLLKSFDDDRRAVRFLLKQFVLENKTAGRKSGSIGRAYEELQAEYTHLKQAASSQRIQTEQTIADLRHRVQALTGTVQEQQKKIDEKNIQIDKFRHLYAKEGNVAIPGSSHSNSSGGGRQSSLNIIGSGGTSAPPMQGFVIQKQARERAKEQALEEITRSRGPVNGSERQSLTNHMGGTSEIDSVITPIQVPPPNYHPQQRHLSPYVIPNTPRIRDLSAGSSYVFTSSGTHNSIKRPRYGAQSSSSSSSSPVPANNYGYARSGSGGRYTPSFGGFRSR
jgi:hypothetical protein